MSGFGRFVAEARRRGELVVQPRMGYSDPGHMRDGLAKVRSADALTAGTITLDSYTRVGDHVRARQALLDGNDLNGYPLVVHGAETTATMVEGIHGQDFPVQVRHGSALPSDIVRTLLSAGLDATEGGPISYCLPYGRTPLKESVAAWAFCCDLLGSHDAHLESFGGCLMGQLCPPGMLVAVTLLEGLFFRQHGVRSISLSYAQQANVQQDLEAISALRELATKWLPDVEWHIVLYTYMGAFPRSPDGARKLVDTSARLAAWAGVERLIVKTAAEAVRIPTIEENIESLEVAAATARQHREERPRVVVSDTGVLAEAETLIEAVLELDRDLGQGILRSFERGILDIPYCLHQDNANRARAVIDTDGRLLWRSVGKMPIEHRTSRTESEVGAMEFLRMLSFMREKFDDRRSVPSKEAWLESGSALTGPPERR